MNNGQTPGGEDRSNSRGSVFLLASLAVVLVVGTASLTYFAVADQWAPDLTGVFYDEAEFGEGVTEAETDGYSDGLEAGESIGFRKGEVAGYQAGYDAGLANGLSSGYDRGYTQGSSDGWNEGYYEGWDDGYSDGWYDGCISLFNGLGTDRVGDWWDYYYSSYFGSYYNANACG